MEVPRAPRRLVRDPGPWTPNKDKAVKAKKWLHETGLYQKVFLEQSGSDSTEG